jgi:LysR family transcriptional regulator, hca operon transcriptional activator
MVQFRDYPEEIRMELRLFRYFVAVAEELNVTRAAEHLHTAQPSLSQQIRQLEGVIGAPLFHRDKHRLQLTDAGRVLLPTAKSILASVENAIEEARAVARTEEWTIALGMIPGPEGKIFSHILPILLRYHPTIQLLLRTMTAPEQIKALQKREITAGFLRGPIDSSEITSQVYMREDVVVVLPQDCPLAAMDRVPVSELAKLKLISILAAVAPAVHNVAEEIERRSGVKFQMGFCTENLMTSLNAVASGLGFSFFATYVEEIAPKGVVTRPIDLDPAPQLDLLFAYRTDDPLPALAKLVSLVREHSPFHVNTVGKPEATRDAVAIP